MQSQTITRATADAYINYGAYLAANAGSTWNCKPTALIGAAVSSFAKDVNTAKETTNVQIASVKANKYVQYEQYQAYLAYLAYMEALEAQRLQNIAAIMRVTDAARGLGASMASMMASRALKTVPSWQSQGPSWVRPAVNLAAGPAAKVARPLFAAGIKAAMSLTPVDFIKDLSNLDSNNTNPKKALDSTYISWHKGKPVIRLAGMDDRSFSLGVLFISPSEKSTYPSSIKVLDHEVGHVSQLQELGLFRYLLFIGTPSATSTLRDDSYYRQPWEITAEHYGGNPHVDFSKPDVQADLQKGFNYLEWAKNQPSLLGWAKNMLAAGTPTFSRVYPW